MKQILNTLYVQTQGTYLRLDHDTLKLEVEKEVKFQIPLHHLGGLVVFGNVLLSPFLIQRCGEDGRSIVWLTQRGQFKGRLAGPTTGNVLLRQTQYQAAHSPDASLHIARYMVAGKLQNARTVTLRAAREAKAETDGSALRTTAGVQADSILSAKEATDIDKLRGIEGYGAKAYFGSFSAMVRTHRDTFEFRERSKRPPKDPINALLSFAYTLLANECVAACEGVGLDPQLGFLHGIRPGRPALALDLMEEFRAPFADRLILTLVNRNQIKPKDFEIRPGGSVYMTDSARKTLLTAYQKRKQDEVPHTVVGSKVPLGLIPHIQARLLARHLRGDIPHYQPFVMQG
ncbi:MAG: type I-C CRISPR-associated endonuclease Cas1c [Cyanobacteria bacterium P01_F01_bin.86]